MNKYACQKKLLLNAAQVKKLLNYSIQHIGVELTCLFLFRHYEAQKDSPDIQWKVGRNGLCFEESVSMQII